ncbi:Fc.00g014910.m01.CDS01 [Cosmosporella sp. VM-42]
MPGGDKKWDISAERDLCVAIILGNAENERVRHNWPKIYSFMSQLGYGFTKDAISQHFTKVIMKDFKGRHGTTGTTPVGTPVKNTSTPRKRTPSKRKKAPESDEDMDDESPLEKKPKVEKNVKQETGGARVVRERSATVLDEDAQFQQWMSG